MVAMAQIERNAPVVHRAPTGPPRRLPASRALWEYGRHFQRLRLDRLLTQEDLSRLSGVSRTVIGQIETGQSRQTMATLRKLRTALRLDDRERCIFLPDHLLDEVTR